LFQPPRGTRDFLPADVARRRFVETNIRSVFEKYGFQEIVTPIFEYFDLYALRSGEKIREDMYVFKGKEREREEGFGVPPEYVLRPELTAPVCRMFVSGDLANWPRPIKVYYIGQCFRYDRPGPGRYREFWQAGIELLGSRRPEADAEVMAVGAKTLQEIGLKNYELKIGNLAVLRGILEENGVETDMQNKLIGIIDRSVGDISKLGAGEEIRDENGQKLDEVEILQRLDEELYNLGIRSQLKDTIMKMIGLKGKTNDVIPKAREVFASSPKANEALTNLEQVLTSLEDYGVKRYAVDLSVARGLDFYTATVFEFDIPVLGAQKQVCGGGRYDNLIQEFGGPPTPATGFAFGFDRLVEASARSELKTPISESVTVFVVPAVEELRNESIRLAERLRSVGVRAGVDLMGRSLNEALSHANKMKIRFALILGPKELEQKKVILRDLTKRTQRKLRLEQAVKGLSKT
jgi:histidyl-tRNA synthetase